MNIGKNESLEKHRNVSVHITPPEGGGLTIYRGERL